ncbi:hypothetical protein H310_12797 [Aphanomyces invadans]|uniref:Man1/Src1 C-terminal domain-containing protein n=1 Tax=Aphanomyces invadans TaxID=157072 RepID=A0A024THX3_9STRA|nr:hypothetical protein H310_12797 [Aphanomyces invadans]ETV93196.1 hypothetical protein H310_12797 [Aphanomyces invadans]|eukprot:XP_008878218.1 hypothetical protein H310_12797 [Aphanomyces invadans]
MTTMPMPTDDLLSPTSKLLSPVTRLDKAKEIMNEQQQKRMAALSDERIREVMAKDPATRTLRRSTSALSFDMHNMSASDADVALTSRRDIPAPVHRESRRMQMHAPVVESNAAAAEMTNALELERSYELLRRLDNEDIRSKRRAKAAKKNVVPTSNYHLKHYGLADVDRINIYAPFEGTALQKPTGDSSRSAPHLSPRTKPTPIPNTSVHNKNRDVDDEAPQLLRRKVAQPSPSSELRHSTTPLQVLHSPTKTLSSTRKNAKQQQRATRSTPMKARLRPRHASSTFAWTGLGHFVVGAGIVCGVGSCALLVAEDNALIDAVATFDTSLARTIVQRTTSMLLHRYVLITGLLAALVLLLWLSQGLSASDERSIDRLVVCAKEELLLHATSNLPGHTAIPEAYLREAILDLLGYKGPKRDHADSLWPCVRQVLASDRRIQCFQVKSKRGVYLWEWIAPQSEVAMKRYAAAVTSLRNEHA